MENILTAPFNNNCLITQHLKNHKLGTSFLHVNVCNCINLMQKSDQKLHFDSSNGLKMHKKINSQIQNNL